MTDQTPEARLRCGAGKACDHRRYTDRSRMPTGRASARHRGRRYAVDPEPTPPSPPTSRWRQRCETSEARLGVTRSVRLPRWCGIGYRRRSATRPRRRPADDPRRYPTPRGDASERLRTRLRALRGVGDWADDDAERLRRPSWPCSTGRQPSCRRRPRAGGSHQGLAGADASRLADVAGHLREQTAAKEASE